MRQKQGPRILGVASSCGGTGAEGRIRTDTEFNPQRFLSRQLCVAFYIVLCDIRTPRLGPQLRTALFCLPDDTLCRRLRGQSVDMTSAGGGGGPHLGSGRSRQAVAGYPVSVTVEPMRGAARPTCSRVEDLGITPRRVPAHLVTASDSLPSTGQSTPEAAD